MLMYSGKGMYINLVKFFIQTLEEIPLMPITQAIALKLLFRALIVALLTVAPIFLAAYLREIGTLLADSGWLYLEVPVEQWRPAPGSDALRAAWLKLLLPSRPLLMVADLLCTASRIKLGRLPPLGFVAMREHLNYFTAAALRAILTNGGFTVHTCGINRAGQLFAVARKFATVNAGSDKTLSTITC